MPLTVKVKMPKRFQLSAETFSNELDKALDTVIKDARLQFINTMVDFDHKVIFDIKSDDFQRTVSTDDENYVRLNNGTVAHMIYPKPGGVLRFPSAFGRKTNPNQLYSMPGYKSTDFIYTKLPVMNPGFPARNFDKAVAKYIKPKFKKAIQDALKRATKS